MSATRITLDGASPYDVVVGPGLAAEVEGHLRFALHAVRHFERCDSGFEMLVLAAILQGLTHIGGWADQVHPIEQSAVGWRTLAASTAAATERSDAVR